MSIQAADSKIEKLKELEFARLKIPRLIPFQLIDSVKGRTFTPEQFYRYQESQIDNPGNFLYALIDKAKKIQGYLWAENNVLDGTLFVNTFSISKEFWGKGEAMKIAINFIDDLSHRLKSPKVLWCTSNEKFFRKHGFKASKIILMEYNKENTEVINGSE